MRQTLYHTPPKGLDGHNEKNKANMQVQAQMDMLCRAELFFKPTWIIISGQ